MTNDLDAWGRPVGNIEAAYARYAAAVRAENQAAHARAARSHVEALAATAAADDPARAGPLGAVDAHAHIVDAANALAAVGLIDRVSRDDVIAASVRASESLAGVYVPYNPDDIGRNAALRADAEIADAENLIARVRIEAARATVLADDHSDRAADDDLADDEAHRQTVCAGFNAALRNLAWGDLLNVFMAANFYFERLERENPPWVTEGTLAARRRMREFAGVASELVVLPGGRDALYEAFETAHAYVAAAPRMRRIIGADHDRPGEWPHTSAAGSDPHG